MSLAFCKGVRGVCSVAFFDTLGFFAGGSSCCSERGVPGADAGVVGLERDEPPSAEEAGLLHGGPILRSNTLKIQVYKHQN